MSGLDSPRMNLFLAGFACGAVVTLLMAMVRDLSL